MTRFSIIRYIRSIGDHGRQGADGLGLVDIKPGYRVKAAVVLTDKGRAVAAQFGRLEAPALTKKPISRIEFLRAGQT